MRLRVVTEVAIFSALAIVLSYIIIFRAPQGGDISLVMVPIIFIALRRGVAAGVISGCITGAVTFMFGGFFVSPLQVICDYVLAFGAIGLAGLFAKRYQAAVLAKHGSQLYLWLAGLVAGAASLFFHTLAGIVFYTSYAPKGQPVWLYSLIYNSIYMVPDTILAIVCLMVIMHRLNGRRLA